ncbi:MAG TPA: hypothetical protein VF972_02475 [Actinomycetota bacterium]
MRAAVALANLILGTAYTGYGVMTLIDLKRGWRTMGFSHFGAAWIAMAFTCGPHHLAHGIHLATGGRSPGVLDLVAVVVGLPVGVIWLLLRVEAFAGGRGDRFISGTPGWLVAMPTLAAVYVTALLAAGLEAGTFRFDLPSMMIPNLLLVVIYATIGYFLLRTQLKNRPALGGWSVSGVSLTAVFPTCALMHGIWVLYAAAGLYGFDVHGFVIDWLAVPSGLYFLWVVRGLYRDSLRDWNQAGSVVEPVVA